MTDSSHTSDSPGRQAAIAIKNVLKSPLTADRDQIFKIPLHSLDILDLASSIVAFIHSQGFDPTKCISAINLAAELHDSDIRFGEIGGNKPYIVHPLRNTLRLIRWGATNKSLLIAAILHDTVEDHPFELAAEADVQTEDEYEARNACLKYLAKIHGQDTAVLVEGMSNPIVSEQDKATITREEWNQIYAQHVQDATRDPTVFACKASDFIDNTVGSPFDGSVPLSKKQRMAKKYLPVCDILLQRLNKGVEEHNLPISDQGVEQVRQSLLLGREQLGLVVSGST